MRNFAKKAEQDIANIVGAYIPKFSPIAESMVGTFRAAEENLSKIRDNVNGFMKDTAEQTKIMGKTYPNLADTGSTITTAPSRERPLPIPEGPSAPAPGGASPVATTGRGGGGGAR